MKQRYLITGGAGFIGSHLSEALLARGDHVVALDNLDTGRLSNLDPIGSHPNFKFVQGSVLDAMCVDELVHESDIVVHLAAAVGVKRILEQPLKSFTTNIGGSENVLGAAHRYRRRVLIASTSEVYGKNGLAPLHETSDRILGTPDIARWSYSTAKAVDEILAFAYHRERGLDAIICRFFNTVGPRQSPAYGMVIPSLIRQAVAGEPITIYGDGEQTRCFCHVHDTVDAMLRLLDHPDSAGEAFNIGARGELSMNALAAKIKLEVGSDSEIVLVPYEEAYPVGFEDMRRRVPVTTKIEQLTGWQTTRTIDDILTETIAEARSHRAAAEMLD